MWNWLFNWKKTDSDLDEKTNELKIGYLTIILNNLDISEKSDCQSIIAKVKQIKSDLESSPKKDLTEVINLFSLPSVLKSIAVDNDWEDQYLHIQKRYEEFYRTER